MKTRLTHQLVVRIVLMSTLLATVATAIQLYFDFRVESGEIENNVNQISTIHSVPLTEALWTFNIPLARAQLEALLELQGIEYLEVAGSGVPDFHVGRTTGDSRDSSNVELIYVSNGEPFSVGVLKVHSSFESVYQRLLDKLFLVLATNTMKMLAVSVFIILLIQNLITQPIDRLVQHIREIDVDGHLSRGLTKKGKESSVRENEIDQIESAIFGLESDLKKSYASLVEAKAELDRRVEERTRELNEAKQIAEDLARIDPLTDLNNRRAFFDYAQKIESQSKRLGSSFAVLMVDIDHFKKLNDTYGHEAGDDVLRTVSNILRSRSRDSDVLGRLGGEEFGIVLPDATSEGAVDLADQLRGAVANTPTFSKAGGLSTTVSIGVALSTVQQPSLRTTMALADQALYEAKRTGRNKVTEASVSSNSAKPNQQDDGNRTT